MDVKETGFHLDLYFFLFCFAKPPSVTALGKKKFIAKLGEYLYILYNIVLE